MGKKKKFIPPIDQLQAAASRILSERKEYLIRDGLRFFLNHYEPLNYEMTYGTPLWRIRKCRDCTGFSNISEVHYPPPHFTKAGRINEPGAPMLYVTFNTFTAMKEVGAKVGDYLQIVGYSMTERRPIRSLILGEFTNVHKRGQGNLSGDVSTKLNEILCKMAFEPGLSFVFMDAFLSGILADPEMVDLDYIHSRVLGSLLFEKYPGIQAIHYPSVALKGAMNIVIKPDAADEALQISGTSVLRIDGLFDYDLYRFSVIRNAQGFWQDGSINWKEMEANIGLQQTAIDRRGC